MTTIVLATTGVLLVLSGCASQTSTDSALAGEDKICVSVRSLNSFSALSDREIFVTAGVNNHFLFSVMGICHGLRSANAIGIADGTGRICGDGFGSIIFRDTFRSPQSCRVRYIEHVNDRDEAKQLVLARAEMRRSKKQK